jgi:electron transfer flavoprotein alpha subunit
MITIKTKYAKKQLDQMRPVFVEKLLELEKMCPFNIQQALGEAHHLASNKKKQADIAERKAWNAYVDYEVDLTEFEIQRKALQAEAKVLAESMAVYGVIHDSPSRLKI